MKLATSNLVHNLGLGLAYQKTTFWTIIGGGLVQGSSQKKFGTPYVFLQPLKPAASNFGTQIGFGTSLPEKNVLDQNWRGSGPREHPKKFGTPYVFLQPFKLATSNLVHKMGLGVDYQKTTFSTKIGGVWARGASRKIWDPLLIYATVGASNFKFGTQLGFGTRFPKTTFRTKITPKF